MKVAVSGITPAGCMTATLLADAGEDVCIVGTPEKLARVAGKKLTVRQVWDGKVISSSVPVSLYPPFVPDVLVFADRVQDTLAAAERLLPYAGEATVATIQYGTKTEQIVGKIFPRDSIVTCVLTFGANCATPGDVTLNFKGYMVIGRAYDAPDWREDNVMELMSGAFSTRRGKKIAHVNCTRLLLNLPYCIPGIIGEKVQKAFLDPDVAEVAVLLLKEGMDIIKKDVHIEALPDFNEDSLNELVNSPLPEAAANFMLAVVSLSRVPCEGPVLGSIERGELSEVDYQNGEMVNIARAIGREAPLNSLMVRLVHEVERTGRFIPKDEFLSYVKKI
ncbi:MAG: 2-dehydropantoate 2-reductase N-terminal domain-containing protein [Nitrospirota bacterium]